MSLVKKQFWHSNILFYFISLSDGQDRKSENTQLVAHTISGGQRRPGIILLNIMNSGKKNIKQQEMEREINRERKREREREMKSEKERDEKREGKRDKRKMRGRERSGRDKKRGRKRETG